MNPEEVLREKIATEIMRSLRSYRCQHTRDDEGEGQQLVDLLSPLATIKEGLEELELLRDHLYWDILALIGQEAVSHTDALVQAGKEAYIESFRAQDTGFVVDEPKCPTYNNNACQGAADCRWNISITRPLTMEELVQNYEERGEAIKQLLDIVNESEGIIGWHLNGDVLLWEQVEQIPMMEEALTLNGCRIRRKG
jgi:hypothetical protein